MKNTKDKTEKISNMHPKMYDIIDNVLWSHVMQCTNTIIDRKVASPCYRNILHAVLLVDDEK